jgi:hypothetical protein
VSVIVLSLELKGFYELLMSSGQINPFRLIDHTFELSQSLTFVASYLSRW